MRRRIGFFTDVFRESTSQSMLDGILTAAQEHDLDIIRFSFDWDISNSRIHNHFEKLLHIAEQVKLDAILYKGWLPGLSTPELVEKTFEKFHPLPLVNLGCQLAHHPCVFQNGEADFGLLLKHLIQDHGYRSIVYIEPEFPDSRIDVYKSIMDSHGLWNPNLLVMSKDIWQHQLLLKNNTTPITHYGNHPHGKERIELAWDLLYRLRGISPQAIMTTYISEATSLHHLLTQNQLQVPKDIALTTWGDNGLCRYQSPSLSTVEYPDFLVGYQGTCLALELLNGQSSNRQRAIPGKLCLRQSCGCNPSPQSDLKLADNLAKVPLEEISLATLLQTSNTPLPATSESFLREFFDQFRLSFDSDHTQFLTWLYQALSKPNYGLEQLQVLKNFLTTLPSLSKSLFETNAAQQLLIDQLSIKSLSLLVDLAELKFGKTTLQADLRADNLDRLGYDLVSAPDFQSIHDILHNKLPNSEITGLYLFKETKPYTNQTIFAYQHGKNPTAFDFQDLFQGERHCYFVFIMNLQQDQIVFSFYEKGALDDRTFLSLNAQLSSALEGNRILMELSQSNQKLAQIDQLKNEFIANITHDFRSPLSVTIGASELGLQDSDQNSPNTQHLFQIIYEASIKLKLSIDRLLELSSIDYQGLKIRVAPINPSIFIQEITTFYQSAALSTNITITHQIPLHQISNFYTDVEKLEEILNNLISNAIKFVDPQRGEILICLSDSKDHVCIQVIDNGIGIEKQHVEAIFDRFAQLETGEFNRIKGSGIGLAFCRQLAQALHGTLSVSSEGINQGSCFSLCLPLGKSHFSQHEINSNLTEHRPNHRDEFKSLISYELSENQERDLVVHTPNLNHDGEYDMYKACILIIEDNQLIREIERATLENAGFRNFVLAANGNLGLEAAYSYRPDIIVCDLNLPDLRGDQFQTELISNPDFHRVPIVFVSAQSNKDLIFELRKKGAVAYLTKPVDATELVLNVELHLGKFLDFKRLAFQTQHDELTGLHNRRNVLEQILSRFAQRNYQDNAILLLDIDHLRAINEQYGHQSGDLVLSTVGAVLRQNLRPYDLLGRYGGEEFIIMLPCTNAQGAIAAAEKIRQRLKDLRIPLSAEPVTITVSIGITTLHHHADFLAKELNIDSMFELFECPASPQLNWSYIESLKSKVALKLIELANQAMSHAKIKGRNQICLGDPTGTNTL